MLTDDDKQWITKRLDDERQWMTEQLEKLETALLTEFQKWASPVEMRQRTHTAMLRAIDAEMESLADRVTKLES